MCRMRLCRLVDSTLGTGSKHGYNFSIELTNDEDVEGFCILAAWQYRYALISTGLLTLSNQKREFV